ncbi:TetR/AcrR family transcriptional regulator [Limnoglobus roseus]|uniref:TetR/AcrR family transcriptional regulator n=1 Tax=Limnoglobus roseus TaxID=2598579 RepID=A0A5C1AEV0_9BACT|nr:TetR/AcrR family transcriptional regulator [Limnoglobus roseus]QEL16232.1 TetR/AcrR family transcriptional regulator [Limnoglobus roseus]
MATGRPREFDPDAALDAAMKVFWHKGYEGASLDDLTHAMGINRPSLYAAFGNKESLFRKALDRYAHGPGSYLHKALAKPTAREAAECLLYGGIDVLTCPESPGGCLVVQTALACGQAAESIRRELVTVRTTSLDLIQKRFEKARHEGDLAKGVDCAGLARYVATVMHGLSVQAASGADRKQLQQVAEWALRAWPVSGSQENERDR